MEENKKNNNVGLLVVLFIIIIGLAGFIVYQNFFNEKDSKKEEKEIKEEKKTEFNKEEAKKLTAKYLYEGLENDVYAGPDTDLAYRIAFEEVVFENKAEKVNYCEQKEDKLICDENKKTTDQNENEPGTYYSDEIYFIKYNDVNGKYQSLYGKTRNIPKSLTKVGIWTLLWNEEKNGFYCRTLYTGLRMDNVLYAVKDAYTLEDDKLIVEMSVGETDILNMEQYTILGKQFDTKEEARKYFEENLKEFPYLTFTFNKENGNYVLQSLDKGNVDLEEYN